MLNLGYLKEGSKISEQQYYTIKAITGNTITVVNDLGKTLTIAKEIIERDCYSADQFDDIVRVTRTELVNHFLNIKGEVFTVNYNKQVNATKTVKNVSDALILMDSYTTKKDKLFVVKTLKKQLKDDLKGEERLAKAYKTKVDFEKGRTLAIDLGKEKGEGTYDGRTIQIDHRNLNWFIWKGTKYQVK